MREYFCLFVCLFVHLIVYFGYFSFFKKIVSILFHESSLQLIKTMKRLPRNIFSLKKHNWQIKSTIPRLIISKRISVIFMQWQWVYYLCAAMQVYITASWVVLFFTFKPITVAAQKMKFSIDDFFSKCDQICSFLQIWSHLLRKSLMEDAIFCEVRVPILNKIEINFTYFPIEINNYSYVETTLTFLADFLNVSQSLVKVMIKNTINSARKPWTVETILIDSESNKSYLSSWHRYCQEIWITTVVLNKNYKTQNKISLRRNVWTCKYSKLWNSSFNYCIFSQFRKKYPLYSCSYTSHALFSNHFCKSSSMI